MILADRQLFDTLSAGVWILDAEYRTEYANTSLANLLGVSMASLMGVPLFDFVPEDSKVDIIAKFETCRQGRQAQVEVPLRSHDGRVLWTLLTLNRSADPSAEGAGLVCTVVDITERKRLETALGQTASHYRVLAETAEDHIFVINSDDRVEYVNRAAARQLRSAPDQVIGRKRTEIFPAEVAERQGQSLQRVFKTGKPFHVEGRTLYLEREVWLATSLLPVPDAMGTIRAVLGISRDITERKRAEDALLASQQRLQVVLSNIPLALWATDEDGIVTFCSGRALTALGATPEGVMGHRLTSIPMQPFPALAEHLRRASIGESFSSQVQAGASTFEAWSAPMRDDHDTITGATGVIVDITERRRLETELSDAQKLEAIGRLAGGIAHDFNNNLTAILGFLEILRGQEGALGPELREVQQAAERAAGLVRRLLAFGRRQVLQPRNLSLNQAIESLQPMLRRLIGESIEIVARLAPDLLAVTGDDGEFEQIIMNLALNARDAMPDGGVLTIETSNLLVTEKERRPTMSLGPHVVMTIRDTGTGMDAETRAHVFEPFFTTKPVGEGTGLGLSTVYGIVKQLKGFIWVDSEPGQGTAFHLYLPVASDEESPETAVPEPILRRTDVRRETILLVEDERTVRRFARLALELHGYTVLEAASPDEALTIASTHIESIALLLTDVVMPRMSGPELAEHLKKTRPDLAVLYMSGYPSGLVIRDGLVDPGMHLISKPFRTAELLAQIQTILARP